MVSRKGRVRSRIAWAVGWGLALAVGAVAAPAFAGILVTSGLTATHQVSRGETVRGTIEIENTGDGAWSGTARLAEYSTTVTGVDFATPVERSSKAWIKVEPATLTLAPGERGAIRYEVRVPEEPALRGSYWSTVILQDLDAEIVAQEEVTGVAIRQTKQTAIRINTDLVGSASTEIAFDRIELEGEARRELWVDLGNRGERWGAVAVRVELYDVEGARLGPFAADSERSLYPGSARRFVVKLPDVAAGDYTSLVVADGGALGVFATRRFVRLP